MIKLSPTSLPGVVFSDERGFFVENFNARDFQEAGLPTDFVQDNHSRSVRGVLRGLHYQYPAWQGKLARVLAGEVFDVAVDIRRSSMNFGRWFGIKLTADNHKQLYIPGGFAHGFCVLSPVAEIASEQGADFVALFRKVVVPVLRLELLRPDPPEGFGFPRQILDALGSRLQTCQIAPDLCFEMFPRHASQNRGK